MKLRRSYYLVGTMLVMTIFSCSKRPLLTVEKLDLTKYKGTWYEIARLPNSFEKGLTCVTANYTLKDNGKVTVLNTGRKISDTSKIKTAKGTASVPDPAKPGQLKVSFFWPFSGDYYVIHVDEEYRIALVGAPSRDYLWILSRTPEITESDYNNMTELAREQGFDVERLEKIDQSCNVSK